MAARAVTLPFAAWEPDLPDIGGDQTLVASGVIPAAKGYRPFRQPVLSGGALPSRVLGAHAFTDPSNSPLTVAGTADALYARGGTESSAWQKKSAGTLSAGNNGWNFALYGPGVFAVNGVDGPLHAAVGQGTVGNFAAVPGAPAGRCASPVGDFLMVGDIPGHGSRVQWSGIDNPLFWPVPGTNEAQYAQSDFNDFPEGGRVQAIASGMASYEALVLCESAIYRAQYVGPPYVFQFTDVDKSKGTIAPRSVIQAMNNVFFLAEDGFYATDGGSVRNIGAERVNLWWRANADDKRRTETLAAFDPVNGVIAWAFASTSCPPDRRDRIILFHPELNRFSFVLQDVEWLYVDAGRGVSLEELDGYSPSLDTLPFSLDSKALTNGVPVLASFGLDHRMYLFSGEPVPAVIETAERGGARMMVHGARPVVDSLEYAVFVRARDFQRDTPTDRLCSVPSARDGVCRCHISTRYARARVAIPGGMPWTYAVGVDLYFEEEGGL